MYIHMCASIYICWVSASHVLNLCKINNSAISQRKHILWSPKFLHPRWLKAFVVSEMLKLVFNRNLFDLTLQALLEKSSSKRVFPNLLVKM